jgi:outer membrane protein assembly factor BamE (lipoprotein component of BamABCDE complex)
MGITTTWLRITGLISSGLVFILAGCGMATVHESEVWKIPDEVRTKLSVGDTRNEVRTLLGEPSIDARNLGLEAYLFKGRNVFIPWVIYPAPLPLPGAEATAGVLILYDEDDKIKDIAVDGMSKNSDTAGFHRYLSSPEWL